VSRAHWLGAALALLLVGGAGRAQAYVRTVTTNTALPMCWSRPDLHLSIAAGASLPDLDSATFVAAAQAAAAAWNEASLAPPARCSQLQLIIDVTPAVRADAAQDDDNWITFRKVIWHREPCTPTPVDDCGPYPPEALAITSVYAHVNDGTIVGGDIELNGTKKWADVQKQPTLRSDHFDLQNALAHELGHFIGLDHTCYLATVPPRPRGIDYHGNPVPDCGPASSAEIKATTMYASAEAGDIDKRDLAADDVRAVCDLFPAGMSLPCAPHGTGGGGCAAAGSGGFGGAGLAAALGAVLFALRRRRY
jgi:hypothetical protein